MRGSAGRRARSAFTLVEMAASLAVLSILMVAIGSAFVVTFSAVPADGNMAGGALASTPTLDLLARELATATEVVGGTATAVEFKVPDRDADGKDETIRYSWSGQAGDPLTRAFNGAAAGAVVGGVRAFALSYEVEAVSETLEGTPVQSAEQTILNKTPASVVAQSVTDQNWCGQFVRVNHPAGTLSWSITKVKLQAMGSPLLLGNLTVEVRLADAGGSPTATVLGTASVSAASLPLVLGNTTFTFSGISGLAPSQGICILVKRTTAGLAPSVAINTAQSSGTNRTYLSSSNAGTTWSVTPTSTLWYTLSGTVTSETTTNVAHTLMRRVNASMRAGSDAAPLVRASVRLANAPEVP